jgi:hypothetical protein
MYGENGGLLRAELATLLRQHRIQQRLGGPGIHTVPESTTLEQREALGEQISRYRHAVLVWCHHAVRAATPSIELAGTTGFSRGPAEQLRYRLTRAVDGSTAVHPRLVELTTEQEFPMVESWRHAARAAALGEHDFGAGVGYGRLTEAQCMTVLKDAAEITRGLVVLDRRYAGIPGWKSLQAQGRLGRAAEVCAAFAGNEEPDYTVDLRGWRPPIATVGGPALPGIAGVLQAEHNLLVHLTEFPTARNLRLVLDSQRVLSSEAALRVRDTAPTLAAKWSTRARTYAALVRATRDLGGLVGAGGHAAAEGANAFDRLRRLRADADSETNPLRHFDPLFTRIDDRLSDIIEQGARERLYFLRVMLPRVVDEPEHLIKPVRERYVPISSPVQTALLDIVRNQLRPPPTAPIPLSGAARSRGNLHDAITHRPEPRRNDLSM